MGLNKVQINHIIDVLVNNKNYFNFQNTYCVKKIGEEDYLFDKEPKHTNGGRLIELENMFDVCLKVHKDCGHQGRDTMLKEAEKFYENVNRPIIVLFFGLFARISN